MIGKTSTGFEWDVDSEILDDMEFVDLLAELDNDPTVMSHIAKFMLGAEQKKSLYDHCRNEKGRVPSGTIIKEIGEIIEAFGNTGKN